MTDSDNDLRLHDDDENYEDVQVQVMEYDIHKYTESHEESVTKGGNNAHHEPDDNLGALLTHWSMLRMLMQGNVL